MDRETQNWPGSVAAAVGADTDGMDASAVRRMSISPSSRMRSKSSAVIEWLARAGGGGEEEGADNGAAVAAVVVLVAAAAGANKLVSVVEIAKRELAARGLPVVQYSGVRGVRDGGQRGGNEVRQRDGNEMRQRDGDGDSDSDSDDDAAAAVFQSAVDVEADERRERRDRRGQPWLIVYLCSRAVPGLGERYA